MDALTTTLVFSLIIVAIVVMWWVLDGGKRSSDDDTGVGDRITETAREFSGTSIRMHGRPAIQTIYRGRDITISFPPRRGKRAEHQLVQFRVHVPHARMMRVSGVDAAGDLLARGILSPAGLTETNLARRMAYLRQQGASDIVVDDGWATVTMNWQFVSDRVSRQALKKPLDHAMDMIELVTGATPVENAAA